MIRKDIQTRELADGSQLSIPVFHFSGSEKDAPSAYIQSGVHGSEVQGYLVALQLIEHFTKHQPKGEVVIVPLSNPYALNCKVGEYTFGRFDPVTGDNWNRNYIDLSFLVDNFLDEHKGEDFNKLIPLFRLKLKKSLEEKLNTCTSYSKKLALQLQSLSLSADISIDLHCDTISVPHVYSPTYAMLSVINFGLPFVIEIPHVFAGALDEATFCPWVKLTEKYNTIYSTQMRTPIEAFTVELGNQEDINSQNAGEQVAGILNYLSTKGVVEKRNYQRENHSIYACKLKDFMSVHSPFGGIIISHASLGHMLSAGDTLVSLSVPASWNKLSTSENLISLSTKNIKSDWASIPITRLASAITHEGMVLMKIMTNYNRIS